MKEVQFNINEYCSFTLTQTGAEILNKHNSESNARFEQLGIDLRLKTNYKADDMFKDQLWSIMRLFGGDCDLGKEAPFKYCLFTLHTNG